MGKEKVWEEERKRREAEEAKQDKVFDVKGVQFKMVYVQGGTFQMGETPEQGSDAYYLEKPVHNVTLGTRRVIRGGSCCDGEWSSRVSYRSGKDPDCHYKYLGFRLALVL